MRQTERSYLRASIENKNPATPFIKWAGGKRAIVKELIRYLPVEFNHYYEPFVGGGAFFFALQGKIKKAFLSDYNIELAIAYNVVKKACGKLLEQLENHAKNHSIEYFYHIRQQHNLSDPVTVAARFIYLNKTCFNGLYRVNKKGEFNVPVGRYTNPGIVQKDNLRACAAILRKAKIDCGEFHAIKPKSGDFVYFDPPYHPVNGTSFTRYTKRDFSEKDQITLRDFALKLHQAGVYVMLSNSDTKFMRDIYKNKIFHIETIKAPRLVNCKSVERSAVKELVIRTYKNSF